MYESDDDLYCYPGTTVLKNKLGLKTQDELDKFEAEISFQRSTEPLPPGNLSFKHYCAIHRHLFRDVYTWAGKPREVRITKGESTFCYPENIDREAKKLFKQLVEAKYFKGLSAAEAAESILWSAMRGSPRHSVKPRRRKPGSVWVQLQRSSLPLTG